MNHANSRSTRGISLETSPRLTLSLSIEKIMVGLDMKRTVAEIEKQREDTGKLVMMSLEEWDAICEELTKEDEV